MRSPLLRGIGACIGLLLLADEANAQQKVTVYDPSQYILVDARLLRGALGYTTFGISDVDTLADRLAQGITLRIEARLISGFLDNDEGFVLADAFYLDLALGALSSEPLFYYDNPEDRFSTVASMGYSLLAGYSTDRIGLLAGKRFDWSAAFVGGSTLPGAKLFLGTAPWQVRLEFRPAFSQEFRVLLTGWDNFNADRHSQGFQIDLPFLPNKRFWFTYSLSTLTGDVSYATFDNYQYASGKLTQHLFGLRFGALY